MSSDASVDTIEPLRFLPASSSGGSVTEALNKEREQARIEGYAAGYAAASAEVTSRSRVQQARIDEEFRIQYAQHHTEQRSALSALDAAAQALSSYAIPALESADRSLIESALVLAESVLGAELRDDQHSAAAALRRVIGAVDPSEIRTVRMHPDTIASLPEGTSEATGVSFTADRQMKPGDAVADLPQGFIDARISSVLRRCQEILAQSGDNLR